jgi:hypothetical protein
MRLRSAACLLVLAAACGGGTSDPADDTSPKSYAFGPYTVAAGEEVVSNCVQITLHNDADVYVNSVELTTGPGFHHSNWFYVPEADFFGDDGTFPCDSRNFSEPSAAIFGGVLFAQSTQTPHEIQAFPPGVAVRVPAHSKLFAQIHLLNATDAPVTLNPSIALTPLALADVTTQLAAISFEDQALGLPPQKQSRFTVDCDLAPQSNLLTGADPTFHIYYALAHYHTLGTGLTFEAVRPDGTATMIYSTTTHIGDTLGGPIDPAFDMTGYTRLRVSCNYFNNTDATVQWGTGNQEMCVFLAFSDSAYNWGGGATSPDAPGDATPDGDVMTYKHACSVYTNDAAR